MIKVGVIGATGYAGQQLVWILNNHKEVKIEFISSYSNAGENDGGCVCEIIKKYFEKKLISQEEAEKSFGKIDVLFLALPHGLSEKMTKKALEMM